MTGRIEPEIGDVSPLFPAGVEKEPMLLLDTTGSMEWDNLEGSNTPRYQVIGEALQTIVTVLAAEDSQAAHEKEAGEDAGGLMTVTFAGGQAHNIGDLSPENFRDKWGQIRWGGQTQIMPGWNLLNQTYQDEFGDTPATERPQMLALIITDGEAQDTEQFAHSLEQVRGKAHVAIAVMGYGDEHDQALERYQQVASGNDHVRVVTFGNTTSPQQITSAMLSVIGADPGTSSSGTGAGTAA